MLAIEHHVSGWRWSAQSWLFYADERPIQRLKGAIDSKIAEEQARQRLSQRPPSRSNSSAKRPSSRAISPTKRAQGSRGRQDGDPPVKGPDPADFEPEFVIDDDEASRTGTPRSGTPRPAGDRNGTTAAGKSTQEDATLETGEAAADEPRSSSDLPTDVRVKLRKLEKLESRYHGEWLDGQGGMLPTLTTLRVAPVVSGGPRPGSLHRAL